MSGRRIKLADARQMKPIIEKTLGEALQAGGSLEDFKVDSFRALVVDAFGASEGSDGTSLKTLAGYAVDEGVALVRLGVPVVKQQVGPKLVRATFHHNSRHLLGPSWMTDSGMRAFEHEVGPQNVVVTPAHESGGLAMIRFVDFDFDYYINEGVTGCPAHYLPVSDVLPIEPIADHPDVAPPRSFLDQFFRATVDVALSSL